MFCTARIKQDKEDVRYIMTYIDAWLPAMWKKGHPTTDFATGEIVANDMKDNVIDLKEREGIARDELVGTFTKVNTKLNYYDPIKPQLFKLFEKKTTKKNHSIPEDECQSFTDIFAMYNKKKLDLRKIMDYYVTSEPWVIVDKDEKSCNNNNYVSKSFTKLISYF